MRGVKEDQSSKVIEVCFTEGSVNFLGLNNVNNTIYECIVGLDYDYHQFL